jgi:hypothetical protein
MSPTNSPERRLRFSRPSRRTMLAIGINAAAAAVGVGAWAAYRRANPPPEAHFEGSITKGYYDENADDVGYIPRPNQRVTSRRIFNGLAIYDATYTIGPHGFRVVPATAGPEARASVLMFGDSNVFGEGVDDDETHANLVAAAGKGTVQVHDFGISGWGPHQTLAGLQSGRFARALNRQPTHATFFFIDDHFHRVAGYAPWDKHGPRYRLGANGRPVRDGHFDSGGPPAAEKKPDDGFLGWRAYFRDDKPVFPAGQVALTVAVLQEIARELAKLAPGLRLDVLYWNDEPELLDVLNGPLEAVGATVHTTEQFMPNYRGDWVRYLLSEGDWHPNAAGHRKIADYISREIVQVRP